MPLIPFNTYKPYIKSGELQYCMSLQQPVYTRQPTGATIETWEEIDPEVWCQKIPLRGSETYYAQSFAPGATTIFRCRYRTDIDAGYRFVDAQYNYLLMHPPIDLDGNNAVLLIYSKMLRTTGPAT